MVLFREAWAENVQLLLDSVEALVPLNLFMTVVGGLTPKITLPSHDIHVLSQRSIFVRTAKGSYKQWRVLMAGK